MCLLERERALSSLSSFFPPGFRLEKRAFEPNNSVRRSLKSGRTRGMVFLWKSARPVELRRGRELPTVSERRRAS